MGVFGRAASIGLVMATAVAIGEHLRGQELPPVPRTAGQASSGTPVSVSTGETPVPPQRPSPTPPLADDPLPEREGFFVDPFVEPAEWLQQPAAAAPAAGGQARRSTRG